ncbi:MAG TPA: alkaline phosphatase family protein [Planctomycetota bacterium]|nr:alkaline phosphatase family protein [Planctomycetota bacterium]
MKHLQPFQTALATSGLRLVAAAIVLAGPWASQAGAASAAGMPVAYIGPGAGFAAAGSVLIVAGTFLMAFAIVLVWPFKAVIRVAQMRGHAKPKVKRIVVLGLDGFDPGLAQRFMAEGRMPNLKKLAEEGVFSPLETACPSISPVAWSTYATGVDASRHNIYDFLTRDPCSYMPVLSSSETHSLPRTLNLGFAKVPFGHRASWRSLQKSQPFWKLLGANYVWSSIIRVPITFPPQPFKNGTLLSGMCVPDIQGTQGSFSFYSTKQRPAGKHIGGQQYQVRRVNGVVESNLTGPPDVDRTPMKCPFTVEFDGKTRRATFTIGKEKATVGFREYTPWMVVPFGKITGIARLYVQTWEAGETGDVEIYVTPININPDSPVMPISHPFVYAIYLAKTLGQFATLGLAEDTWALNERVIDEEAFLKQSWLICEERKKQLWEVLDKTRRGFVTVVFDTSDRISHMFYRYLDPTHPANAGKDTEKHKNVIAEMYGKMDELVGELREKLGPDPDTVLMVISDHGFTNFRRGVNLNTWLRENGYLVLKEGSETSPDWFAKVDWMKTRAFTLGLTGVFLNRVGREAQGIVPKSDVEALGRELKTKLEALRDPVDGQAVIKEVFLTRELHKGPYADMAPELLIGYHKGYRHSWDCATGSVTREVFTDNTKSWSGDHCVDPRLVPGVFFSNRKINTTRPSLMDIAPTVLEQFSVEVPAYMQGKSLFAPAAAPAPKAPRSPAAPQGVAR